MLKPLIIEKLITRILIVFLMVSQNGKTLRGNTFMKSYDKKNIIIAVLIVFCLSISALFIVYLIADNNAKKAEIAKLQQPRQWDAEKIAEWVLGEIIKSIRSSPSSEPTSPTP